MWFAVGWLTLEQAYYLIIQYLREVEELQDDIEDGPQAAVGTPYYIA